jgi:hypothetical protein
MFHKNIKLILAALIIGSGIWSFIDGEIGNGIFLIFLSLIPIFLYFKNEFILLAFLKLRKQDLCYYPHIYILLIFDLYLPHLLQLVHKRKMKLSS